MSHIQDLAGLSVHIEGQGDQTLLMIHGWPDTHRVWAHQIDCFKSRYQCVAPTLPGFDSAPGAARAYSVDAVIERLKQLIDTLSPDRPVILMIHDWGCVFGYELAMRFPERVSHIIAIDIGDTNSAEFRKGLSPKFMALLLSYQLTLASAWFMGDAVGGAITRAVARGLNARSQPQYIQRGMNYPYALRWMGIEGGLGQVLPVQPQCPFYFAYARHKPFKFHSQYWEAQLLSKPGNAVREFDSGHWVMLDCAEEFNTEVSQWLDKSR